MDTQNQTQPFQSETTSQSPVHNIQQDTTQSSPIAPKQEAPSTQQQSSKTSEKQSSTNTTHSWEQSHSNENESKALTGEIIGYRTDFVRQQCLAKIEELNGKREFDEITYQFLTHAINFLGDTLLHQGTNFIQ